MDGRKIRLTSLRFYKRYITRETGYYEWQSIAMRRVTKQLYNFMVERKGV